MKRFFALGILAVVASFTGYAQAPSIIGDWKTPLGSIIRFDRCGQQICAWILYVSPSAPSSKDINNPDKSRRGRPLCGMMIGSGFTLNGTDRATGGLLYDPKTGRTYHSRLAAAVDSMEVHGYYGIALLSGSETWARAAAPANPCPMAN
jgi:uncharacterized protein (DUF2147 family)